MKAKTKEEKYLVACWERSAQGEDLDVRINWRDLAKELNFGEKSTENIVNLLAQGNYLIKHKPDHVSITKRGVDLAEDLQTGS